MTGKFPFKVRPVLNAITEVSAAVVISAAAVLTSWASFQAALWDGEQASYYAEASAARNDSTRLATKAGLYGTVDVLMFNQWLDAAARNEPRLQAFYRQRFRPEFAIAFNAWLTTRPLQDDSAPTTPFAMPEYHSAGMVESQARQKEADDLFDKGQAANDIGDAFVRATVLLSVALFFGGIGQTFKSQVVKAVLVLLAMLFCIVSTVQMTQLPIQTLTYKP